MRARVPGSCIREHSAYIILYHTRSAIYGRTEIGHNFWKPVTKNNTIYAMDICKDFMNIFIDFSLSKYSRKSVPKVFWDFQKWTKKMSKNEKGQKTL